MRERDLLVVGNLARDIIFGKELYGGSAATIAVNFARLGGKPAIFSVLGRDHFSAEYKQFLISEGVNVSLIQKTINELPVCEVVSDVNSNLSYNWTDNGCHQAMEELPLSGKLLSKFRLVHLVSCPPRLAQKIAGLNLSLSYEPGPMIGVDGQYFDPTIVAASNFIFLNEEEYAEALKISGFSKPDDFRLGKLPKVLVITKGRKGSEIYSFQDKDSIHIASGSIYADKVVDPTGAGDSYKAGFFAAYLLGKSLSECARWGSLMGAACVSQIGGIISVRSVIPDDIIISR